MSAISLRMNRGRPLSFGTALGVCLALSSASADDSEVFFGQVDPTLDRKPNVMLLLDTSSSMNRSDGVHVTRLERLKEALNRLIDGTTSVNLGLMRFNGSDGGGPVLFPVTNLDRTVCVDDECGLVTVSSRIKDGAGDAQESLHDGSVSAAAEILSIGDQDDGTSALVGLRFSNLGIPQGARIVDASIELVAHEDSVGSASLAIDAQVADDPSAFTESTSDISGRSYGAGVPWSTAGWLTGQIQRSPDLSSILQPVVDRGGWCGGQSLVLSIGGSGRVAAIAADASLSNAPRLMVTYDAADVPDSGGCASKSLVSAISSSKDDAEQSLAKEGMNLTSDDLEIPFGRDEQMIGLRFADLAIPHGALVERATLEFVIDEYETEDVTLSIRAEAVDDAAIFSSRKADLSARATTVNDVLWVNPTAAAIGAAIESPDLAVIVQEIVDRSGWQAGNALSIGLRRASGSGTRVVESYNGDRAAAPKLRIDYRVSSGSGSDDSTRITARDTLKRIVDDMDHTSGTPLVAAYYEAAQYYLGGDVDYGRVRGYPGKSTNRVSHPDSYTGGSVLRDPSCTDANLGDGACSDERILGIPRYVSPISSSCQTNHIVLLTDGGASSNDALDKVRNLIGGGACEVDFGSEGCARSLSSWLYESDLSDAINGKQRIPTFTVGFNLSGSSSAETLLRDLAVRGGGSFQEAATVDELVDAFGSIFGEVLSIDTSFVAPGATVNQYNRLTHRSDIYFAVFKPRERPTWSGNLKRYEIGLGPDGDAIVVDVDGQAAVDPSSGYFSEHSRSWWSDVIDGNVVELGGAAGEMTFDELLSDSARRAFTFTGDSGTISPAGADLTSSDHALHKDNPLITQAMLALGGTGGTEAEIDARRDLLLDWALGIDVLDDDDDGDASDWRGHMGDPMHSRPVILNYGETPDTRTTIFVATNEGFLHAIDRDEGRELYAFLPQELLPNLGTFVDNSSTSRHPYGLDGAISLWVDDVDNNVVINDGEAAHLYVGMRRGGSNYYAIDVSERDRPRLKWVIRGGPGGTPGFEEMGQSWSRMAPAKIRFEGRDRQVLIFGAGYDINQDADPSEIVHSRTTDSQGRGIYIVDANDGSLLWSALGSAGGDQFFSDMEYSIPSDIRVIDIDFDGVSDQLYVGDMGGQVWRFDITPWHTTGDLLQGGVIADLSGADPAEQRRFYYEPDVALIGKGGERFLSIGIGSGWRAHPLDNVVEDRFYLLKSNNVYDGGGTYGRPHPYIDGAFTPVTESDLLDVTGTMSPGSSPYGWYLDLEGVGEKVLGDSITVNNQVIFTSYKPDASVGACSTAIGGGSAYVLDVVDGSPTIDMDGDGIRELADRAQELAHGGIPPEPVALITEHGPTVLIGPEQPVDPEFSNLTQRSHWVDLGPAGESARATASAD